MSKVKIQGNASGTGVLTVTAPNTSTDRTITLPDSTGSLIADDGSGKVGIGTASPNHKLSVSGAGSQGTLGLYSSGTSNELRLEHDGGSHWVMNGVSDGIRFKASNSEKIRIDGDGLKFNGDTAAANALDDYEEGTWTPMLTDTSNNATMHALNGGVYTKIGRVVHCTANVRNSGLGSVSGNLYLSGFPFTSGNTNGNHGAGAVANAENMAITAGHAITLYYSKNSSSARFDIYDNAGGVTVLQASEWSSDGQASIQVTFSIA